MNYRKMTTKALQIYYRKMAIKTLQMNYRKMTINTLQMNYRKNDHEYATNRLYGNGNGDVTNNYIFKKMGATTWSCDI